jgi:hypothetical protein
MEIVPLLIEVSSRLGSPSKIAAKRIIPTIGKTTEIIGMSKLW